MDHNSVKLRDRTLWFDGDSTVDPQDVITSLMNGLPVEGLFVENLTDEITEYNKYAVSDKKIGTKSEIRPLSFDWNIPEEYLTLDVVKFLLTNTCFDVDASDASTRCQRVLHEISLYDQLNLMDVLRVLIYVINTLHHNNVMWGVGRGSSVSSYVLYLIGVHDIDSVKYDLDVSDFLRTTEL